MLQLCSAHASVVRATRKGDSNILDEWNGLRDYCYGYLLAGLFNVADARWMVMDGWICEILALAWFTPHHHTRPGCLIQLYK